MLVNNLYPNPPGLPPGRIQEGQHRVRLVCSRISSATVIVGSGEVDACNAHDVEAYVVSHLDESSVLLLDFTEMEFFGITGFLRCTT